MACDRGRRLGVESVDLYQAHAWDPHTPLTETLRTLDRFVRAGKIRYYGLSNFTGWQLTKAVHTARARGLAEPITLQPQYSLLVREIEWEIVPAALDAGLGLLPWSPLGGGWLSGKYRRDQRPSGETRLGEDPGLARFIDSMARRVDGRMVSPELDDLGAAVVGSYLGSRGPASSYREHFGDWSGGGRGFWV